MSEVDKKGKKKKGTLGIGGGNMFFASESDKVCPTCSLTGFYVWFSPSSCANRLLCRNGNFRTSSLIAKRRTSMFMSTSEGQLQLASTFTQGLKTSQMLSYPSWKRLAHHHPNAKQRLNQPCLNRKRFQNDREVAQPNQFILTPPSPRLSPPREDDVEAEYDDVTQEAQHDDDDIGEGERAVVLYDFTADGDDEMSVHEGETLLVLERDTDEWWKCKNARGDEGVVPANYLEVSSLTSLLIRLN